MNLTIAKLLDHNPITRGAAPPGLSRAIATVREGESETDEVWR